MSKIADFKPLNVIKANEQLDAFVAWAQATLPKGVLNQRVYDGIRWDMSSWHKFGLESCAFTALGSARNSTEQEKKYMRPAFMDFAKALVVHYAIFRGKRSAKEILYGARALEVSLFELTGTSDITRLTAAICNRACEYFIEEYPTGNSAYKRSKNLEHIVQLMVEKKLLAKPFPWTTPLRNKQLGTLKEQQKNRENKLPSRASILALGELFNNDLTSPLDIITVTACALLLSQPSRVGELPDVEHDCIVFKDDVDGGQRMFLRWYSEKGFGATIKPVVTGMEASVERVVRLLMPITNDAREYAAWLEDYPDQFPPHDDLPLKDHDEPLSYNEACSALKIKLHNGQQARSGFKDRWLDKLEGRSALSPPAQEVMDEIRQGWDNGPGTRSYENGKLSHYQFKDKAVITLRKLNILLREKYLPKNFPYTTQAEDGKKRVKYRDALFTVRTGSLPNVTKSPFAMQRRFGVEIAANQVRLTAQLGGASQSQSIFQRHGYGDLRVNTHSFRHELNTEMHRAGLSQLLIDAFSGRTSQGSVYNHTTVEERTQAVAAVHPKTKLLNAANCLDKIITNKPLTLSDLVDLEEGESDRIVHRTHLGLCIHRFEVEPCPKMGACTSCGNLGCVKGDSVKLANLKEERSYLKLRYEAASRAEAVGVFGSSEWRAKTALALVKCNALIDLLESPKLSNGDIVWNADNGWNLTNNSSAMNGLIAVNSIEYSSKPKTISLDEIAAILERIEE